MIQNKLPASQLLYYIGQWKHCQTLRRAYACVCSMICEDWCFVQFILFPSLLGCARLWINDRLAANPALPLTRDGPWRHTASACASRSLESLNNLYVE